MRTSARVVALCVRVFATGLLALVLSACSRTVTWEEEVPLNTGERRWITRTDTYLRATEPGNPLKAAWSIEKRAMTLLLHERRYTFEAETTDIFMVFDYGATVAVVAWSTECDTRGYAEYRWAKEGWQLQKSLNPLLIGLPRNLMGYFSPTGDIPPRASIAYKQSAGFDLPQRGGEDTLLRTSRVAVNCKEK
ncbi:MAG: hypothetical protein ACYC0T_20990 [Ramlibacter sp.]